MFFQSEKRGNEQAKKTEHAKPQMNLERHHFKMEINVSVVKHNG